MTSQKNHSNANQSKNHNAKQPRQRKWLVALLVLPIFIAGYLISSQPSSETIVSPIANSPALADQVAETESTFSETNVDSNEVDNANDMTAATVGNPQELDSPSPEAILNAPLPETNSLAKEEIDRLDDERQRLKEQEKMVAEQVAMTKNLTEMKAEQIDLLEQQIAELEAKQAAQ